MRELKFREWDANHKEMHAVGQLLCPWADNDATKIMQFTGLHDKNGKEIYEGDAALFDPGSGKRPFKVVYGGPYNIAAFGITSERTDDSYGSNPTWDTINERYAAEMEIIGNIYETPELIAGQE